MPAGRHFRSLVKARSVKRLFVEYAASTTPGDFVEDCAYITYKGKQSRFAGISTTVS
jgi:hypothetical protein